MGLGDNRRFVLALAHARLHAAADLIHWAKSGSAGPSVNERLDKIVASIRAVEDELWKRIRADKGKEGT